MKSLQEQAVTDLTSFYKGYINGEDLGLVKNRAEILFAIYRGTASLVHKHINEAIYRLPEFIAQTPPSRKEAENILFKIKKAKKKA